MNKLILILLLPITAYCASDSKKPESHLLDLARGQQQEEIFDQILAYTRDLRNLNCVGNKKLKEIIAKYMAGKSALTAHEWEAKKDKITGIRNACDARILSHDKTKIIELTDNVFEITDLATLEKFTWKPEEHQIAKIYNSNIHDVVIVELETEEGETIIQLIDLNEYIAYKTISYIPINIGQSVDSDIFLSQDKNFIVECDLENRIFNIYNSRSGKLISTLGRPGLLNFVYGNKLMILERILNKFKLKAIDINSEEPEVTTLWESTFEEIAEIKYLIGHSKDGKIIFYLNSKKELYLYNCEKLTNHKLDSSPDICFSISISDDNKYIIGITTNNIIIWSIDSGNIISVIKCPEKITSRVMSLMDISFDGSMIAIIICIDVANAKYLVGLYNVDHGCYMYCLDPQSNSLGILISRDGKSIYYGPQITFKILN